MSTRGAQRGLLTLTVQACRVGLGFRAPLTNSLVSTILAGLGTVAQHYPLGALTPYRYKFVTYMS